MELAKQTTVGRKLQLTPHSDSQGSWTWGGGGGGAVGEVFLLSGPISHCVSFISLQRSQRFGPISTPSPVPHL